MEKLTVRAPRLEDFGATLFDLLTLRAAPPVVVSTAFIVVLTGSILNAVLTVLITSYVDGFWTRLVREASTP